MRTLSDGPHLKGTLSRGHGRVDTWTSRAEPPEMLILLKFFNVILKNRPLRRCDDRHLQCGGGALGPLTLHLEPMPLLARVVAVLNSMELAGSSRCSRREGQERPAGHTTSGCGGSRSTWSRCLAFAAVASYLLRNMGQWRPRCCERVTRGASMRRSSADASMVTIRETTSTTLASSRIEWNILEYTTIYLNI